MNDLYRKSTRSERPSEDPYFKAVCWERSWEQQQNSLRSFHSQPDEAGWASLEGRISDGAIFRKHHWLIMDIYIRWNLIYRSVIDAVQRRLEVASHSLGRRPALQPEEEPATRDSWQ